MPTPGMDPLTFAAMAISRDVTRRGHADPSRPAIVGPSGPVSFGSLSERANRKAEQLGASGVEAGGRIAVAESDPVELLVGIIAADLIDAAAVVMDVAWPEKAREVALKAATVAAEPFGDAINLVLFTPGATGAPRPVPRTRRSWTTSFPTFSALTGIGPDDTVLIPGRLTGSLFLYGALHALTVGASIYPVSQWSAERAAEACTTCTSAHLVPAMLSSITPRLEPTVSRLRTAVCAGGVLDPTVQKAATDAGVNVIDYYGAPELSIVAIRRPGGGMRPFPSVDVRIEDGVIYAAGPYLASGVAREEDGYATVGHHGRWDEDGSLEVLGRGADAIVSGGTVVVASGVESALRQSPDVGEVTVVGRPHPQLGQVVAAVIERGANGYPSLAELREHATTRLSEVERPRLWYIVDRLPRTSNGTVSRSRVRSGLADGSLRARPLR